MKAYKKIVSGSILAAMFVASGQSAFAAEQVAGVADSVSNRMQRAAQYQQLKEAVKSGDFTTWKDIIAQYPKRAIRFQSINEGNFAKFGEMMEARANGDYETAKQIRGELELPKFKMKKFKGKHHGEGDVDGEHIEHRRSRMEDGEGEGEHRFWGKRFGKRKSRQAGELEVPAPASL